MRRSSRGSRRGGCEKQRLLEYADELEAQLTMVSVANRSLSPQDKAAQLASQSAIRAAVARLRRIEPIGRIVLNVRPDSVGVDSLPDIALEDGDRFVVPRIPSNVTVENQGVQCERVHLPAREACEGVSA